MKAAQCLVAAVAAATVLSAVAVPQTEAGDCAFGACAVSSASLLQVHHSAGRSLHSERDGEGLSMTGYLCGLYCGSSFTNGQSLGETQMMEAYYANDVNRSCQTHAADPSVECDGFWFKPKGKIDECCQKHDKCCGNGKLGRGGVSGKEYANCNHGLADCAMKHPNDKCRTQDGVDNQLKDNHGGNTRTYSGPGMSAALFAGLGVQHVAGGALGFKACCGAIPGKGRCPVNSIVNDIGKGIESAGKGIGKAVGGMFRRRRRRRRRKR